MADLSVKGHRLGHRICPNEECALHVFIVTEGGQLLRTYPPLRIDFDSESVPQKIISALDEAISCHANECYISAAIMVRRALEELCEANSAKGSSLNARISDLGAKVILPPKLLSGLDDLRLLGNDAAHVESKTYDTIGPREVDIAIRFTKEVLKALYQYSDLLDELQSLKNGPESPGARED